jgi:non-ribosomal peptide synthetase component E (peptide arylation enzyme)
LATNLEESTIYSPDRSTLIEDGRKISFLEFNQEFNRITMALISLGVRAGDYVALYTPNAYQWPVFLLPSRTN